MSPPDAAVLPMSSGKTESSPLSASQIAALIRTVGQALARGQSVSVMSDGRMLARYLPSRADEEKAGGSTANPDRVSGRRT